MAPARLKLPAGELLPTRQGLACHMATTTLRIGGMTYVSLLLLIQWFASDGVVGEAC